MKKTVSLPSPVSRALHDTGLTIAAARKSRGMSQADLAARVGVTPFTVARMEQGHPGVSLGAVFKALWLLDLPLWPSLDVEAAAEIRQLQAREALMARKVGRPRMDDDF